MSDPVATPVTPWPEDLRPLPASPNLEFERKAAKHLLRDALAHDAGAVARLRATQPGNEPTHQWQLADAQLVVARQYGFASWPRLVAYYESWNRHRLSQHELVSYRPQHYLDDVARTLAAHRSRRWWMAPSAAAFVPRCYGKSDDEVFDTPLSEAEVRHLVARREMFATWDDLMAAANRTWTRDESVAFADSPFGKLQSAIIAEDISTVQELIGQHPEFVRSTKRDNERVMNGHPRTPSIIGSALLHERKARSANARAITDWLASQGADLQSALNTALIGGMRMTAEDFEWLIARGADVTWVPANGMSLIEHALLRCWNPGPADVLARYLTPRKAFWIAAGMNDVQQLREYFAPDGSLTDPARSDRPDYIAAQMRLLTRPGVDDRDLLWEAGGLAIFNQRWEALDFLIARGFDIDYSPWRFNYLHWAVGNLIVPVVEQLVRRGADLDLKGWHPYATAREMAAERLEGNPENADVQRIWELVIKAS